MLQVIELAQEMTSAMVTIYDAIVDLMDACIKELKRANKIDTSEMSLEECLFKSFDDMIRRQLDPIWHTVTTKTKQVRGVLTPHLASACWHVKPLLTGADLSHDVLQKLLINAHHLRDQCDEVSSLLSSSQSRPKNRRTFLVILRVRCLICR